MDPDGWLDVSAWFIREMNSVLGRLQFEEQLMKMIPKAKNTSKHKYNQSSAMNNTAKAIQSKQYNQQYGQSNQSDMTNDTIRTTPGVVSVILLI